MIHRIETPIPPPSMDQTSNLSSLRQDSPRRQIVIFSSSLGPRTVVVWPLQSNRCPVLRLHLSTGKQTSPRQLPIRIPVVHISPSLPPALDCGLFSTKTMYVCGDLGRVSWHELFLPNQASSEQELAGSARAKSAVVATNLLLLPIAIRPWPAKHATYLSPHPSSVSWSTAALSLRSLAIPA